MNALLKKLLVGAAIITVSTAASASTADTTFNDIVTKLTDWAEGSLGKTISLAMLVVGIAAGIVRQSVMAAVAGVAGALVMSYGPAVLTGIFTATI